MNPTEHLVEAWTDGACRGNPGPGGWGVLLRSGQHEKSLYGFTPETTNNRMELTAALKALESIKKPSHVILYTDSQYVMKGMTVWIPQWIRRQWHTADKKPVKNRDLWESLHAMASSHLSVQWHWIKGHTGHPENETADRLANLGIDENV